MMLLIGFLAVGVAQADVKGKSGEKKKTPELPIPEVRAVAATFVAGQAVDIELSASTRSLQPVEFLIRQQPANGTLSAVRSHPRETNKGIVTYTHRGGDAPLSDRFMFACRVDGGPVSAPGAVTLTGRRFEPKLEIIDFTAVDKVFLGGEATFRFAAKNIGDADFAADIPWEDPWRGPPRIELKAGETGKFVVVFHPAKPGVYRLEKIIQPGVAGSKLPLYGQCVRPLTVSPGHLVLMLGPSGAREGELVLSNGHPEPLRVQVQTGGRLQGGGGIDVPGGGRARVSLVLPAQDVAAFKGEVQVTSTQGGETVTVEAAAKPAVLRVISPAAGPLDLGRAPRGREVRGEVTLKNVGGTTSLIQAQARAPLSVTPSGQAVRLEPEGQAVFTVTMTGDQPGPLAGELSFSGDASAPRISVEMEVLPADSRTAAAMSTPRADPGAGSRVPTPPVFTDGDTGARTPMQQLLLSYLASNGLPVPKARINPFLERVTRLELLRRTSHGITIAWKKPSVVPMGWIIEGSTMALAGEDGGNFVKIWTPLKNWKIVDGGDNRVAVLIEPLPAASQLELRIMGVDRDEKVSEPSPSFIVTTAEAWRLPSWVWQVLIVTLLAVATYILNKIRSGEWEWKFRRDPGHSAS